MIALAASVFAPTVLAQNVRTDRKVDVEKGEKETAESKVIEPSTLLVRITKGAKFVGFPAVCPGSSLDENQEDVICLAELYEARVRVLKNLGGPKTVRNLTIRFTAHSYSAVWQKEVEFLLLAIPFEDKGATGHFAYYWDWQDESGEICTDIDSYKQEEWEPLKRAFSLGKTRIVNEGNDNWSKGSEIICITGKEKGLGVNG